MGGDKEAIDAVKPLFDVVGRSVTHAGPAGAGEEDLLDEEDLQYI